MPLDARPFTCATASDAVTWADADLVDRDERVYMPAVRLHRGLSCTFEVVVRNNSAVDVSQRWLDEHLQDLLGLPGEAAVEVVERAGLLARVVPSSGGWLTQELRRDRLTLWLNEDGSVASVDAG